MAIVSMDSITEFQDEDNDFVLVGNSTDKTIKKMAVSDFLTNVNADGSTSGGTTSIPFNLEFTSKNSYLLTRDENENITVPNSTPFKLEVGTDTWFVICDEEDITSYISYLDDNHVSVIVNYSYKQSVDWDTELSTAGETFNSWYMYTGGKDFKISFPVSTWYSDGRVPYMSDGVVSYVEAPVLYCSGMAFGEKSDLWVSTSAGIEALIKLMSQNN